MTNMISDLHSTAGANSAVAINTAKLLPAESAVVSTVESNDAGKRSVMVVGVNQYSAQANRDHVVAALQDSGLRVTQEGPLAGQDKLNAVNPAAPLTVTLSSATEEATLTISDAGRYRTVLIHRVREAN